MLTQPSRYQDNFQDSEAAKAYDEGQYATGSYESAIHHAESLLLESELARLNPERALDFACGTGRMTETLARHCRDVVGVDVSAAMVERAKQRVPAARFETIDTSCQSDYDIGTFDLVLAFRLLLNNELDSSLECLRWAGERLRPGGVIVANNHGNLVSHKMIRRPDRNSSQLTGHVMADSTVRRLAADAGLNCTRIGGTTLLGATVGRRLGGFAGRLEHMISRTALSALGSNQMYRMTPVASPSQS